MPYTQPPLSREEYQEIKKENQRKLDELLSNPNYMEELGRKYYGDRWFTIFEKGHYKKAQHRQMVNRYGAQHTAYMHRPIIQYDLDGNQVGEWASAKIWADSEGRKYSAAQHVAKCALGVQMGGRETAYGYKWEFKNEE